MKKVLLGLTVLSATVFGLSTTNAAVLNLEDINTTGTTTNAYIVGNRVYDLNTYVLTVRDITEASAEYAVSNGGAVAPVYYLYDSNDGLKMVEIVGKYDESIDNIPTEEVDVNTKYVNGRILGVTRLNDEVLTEEQSIENEVIAAVENLNATATNYGFKSITYNSGVVTFDIEDPERELKEYAQSGIVDLFINAMKDGSSVTYTLGDRTITKDLASLTTSDVMMLAKEILVYLSNDGDLKLGSVAGKDVSATVTFVDGSTETYTVKFAMDYIAMKDQAISNSVATLNTTAKDYGFESISYNTENKTVSFVIANPDRDLKDYAQSGIVDLFMQYIDGAKTVTYNLGGTTKTIDATNLTSSQVVSLAKEILVYLSSDGNLKLGSVAGKNISAEVTYMDNSTATYKVEFAKSYVLEKDEKLAEVATTLNATANDYGFESVSYNAENKTVSFSVANPDRELKEYAQSGIVQLFMQYVDGAKTITYNLGGTTKTIDATTLNNSQVVSLAKEILVYLSNDGELKLGSVIGKNISADVVYNDNTTATYTVAFTGSYVLEKDEKLTEVATTLNATANDYGFDSVSYNAENKTVSFVIANPDRDLKDYAQSGIVELFMQYVEGAKTVTYNLGGTTKTVDATNLTSNQVVSLAKEILVYLSNDGNLKLGSVAGKNISAEVTYADNSTATYKVEFAKSYVLQKDEELTDVAAELNTNLQTYGFSGVTYAEDTKTVTFATNNDEQLFSSLPIQGIADLFLLYVDGASKISYNLGENTVNVENPSELTSSDVIRYAKDIVTYLANGSEQLTLGAVKGKSVTANVTFTDGSASDYTVSFS